jgi:Protein of unknown function (DUF1622)
VSRRGASLEGIDMDEPTAFKGLESLTDYTIRVVGSGIEIFGVLIIVTGIVWSTYLHLRRPMPGESTEIYKIRIGRSLLLGLEVLVAADIVKTIAHELSPRPACWAGLGAYFSELDASPGNRRLLAVAATAIAYVIESSAGRNTRCSVTKTLRGCRSHTTRACLRRLERLGFPSASSRSRQ